MLFHKARVKPRLQGRDCCVQRVSLLARVAGSHLQGHPFLLGEAIAGSRLLRILPLLPARSGCIPAAWAREMGLILRPPSRGQGRACQRTLGLEELCIWGGRSHERALRGEHAAAASWRGAAAMLRPGGTGGAASSSSSSCSSSSPPRVETHGWGPIGEGFPAGSMVEGCGKVERGRDPSHPPKCLPKYGPPSPRFALHPLSLRAEERGAGKGAVTSNRRMTAMDARPGSRPIWPPAGAERAPAAAPEGKTPRVGPWWPWVVPWPRWDG